MKRERENEENESSKKPQDVTEFIRIVKISRQTSLETISSLPVEQQDEALKTLIRELKEVKECMEKDRLLGISKEEHEKEKKFFKTIKMENKYRFPRFFSEHKKNYVVQLIKARDIKITAVPCSPEILISLPPKENSSPMEGISVFTMSFDEKDIGVLLNVKSFPGKLVGITVHLDKSVTKDSPIVYATRKEERKKSFLDTINRPDEFMQSVQASKINQLIRSVGLLSFLTFCFEFASFQHNAESAACFRGSDGVWASHILGMEKPETSSDFSDTSEEEDEEGRMKKLENPNH